MFFSWSCPATTCLNTTSNRRTSSMWYEAISRNHAAAEQTKNETPRNNMWHWQIICIYIYIYTFLNLKKSLFCFKKMQAEPTANHKDNPASMPSSSICWSSLSHGRGHWANISHKAEANPLKGQRPRKQWCVCVCCFLSEFGIKHLDQLENSKFHAAEFRVYIHLCHEIHLCLFCDRPVDRRCSDLFRRSRTQATKGRNCCEIVGTPWVGCVQLNHGSPLLVFF